MDTPDDLRQAVAEAINRADNAWGWAARDPELHGGALAPPWQQYVADAVLSVPGIADALARDAKVAEIVRTAPRSGPDDYEYDAELIAFGYVAALYPEAGK